MQQAAAIIEQNFSDPVTINLRYGYASFNNSVDSTLLSGGSGSSGAYANSDAGTTGNYSTVAGWLLGDRTTTDDFNSYNALPNSSSSFPGAANNFYVPNGELRALGQLGNNSTIDGACAFGADISLSELVPVALHEITHAMGRLSLRYTPSTLPVIADWFRFDGSGHFQWTEGNNSASPSYFSIDNGATRIADFGQSSDYSDYLNNGVQGQNDPFNEFYGGSTLHSLTTADLREMDVIGFNRVDDFVQNTTTTGAVAVNGSATGTVTPGGDHDWLRVFLSAGTSYRLDEGGTPSGGGTLDDTTMHLYNSSSTQVGFDDDSGPGLDSRLFYTPSSSGFYYVDAGGFNDTHTGSYTVSVTTDDFDNSSLTTGTVAVGGSSTGSIETAGDRDWFAVNLVAGDNYIFNERGSPTSGGTLSDTLLTLRNSAGASLASDDDSGFGRDSQLAVHASTTGTYYLDAGAFSSNTGSYTIEVQDVGPNPTRFDPQHASLTAYTPSVGWSSQDTSPRQLADVNGDGEADIVGFAQGGVQVSLATGGGNFAAPMAVLANFGASEGWSNDTSLHRELADVNADGRADIVGFAQGGVQVALATGGGNFAAPIAVLPNFGTNAGWSSQDITPRHLADVSGDGRADIVGFAQGGVQVALATGGGHFAAPVAVLPNFGASEGWSNDTSLHRELADVNGDGKADIVGFAQGGVQVALATGGGNFAAPTVELPNFGSNAGWSSQDTYPRHLADVNNDGMADIVAFGQGGVQVALATGSGHFAAPTSDLANFGVIAGGWSSDTAYHRQLADVTGDGRSDIVGFGNNNVLVSASHDYRVV